MMSRKRKGFTLIELIVVCLIIGILTGLAMPSYFKTIETSKADTGSALVKMVGTTNRMYALDHSGVYANGQLTSSCNSASACQASSGNPSSPDPACNLVGCKYLAADEWAKKPYAVAAVNDSSNCPLSGITGSNLLACAKRQGGSGTYAGWGYTIDTSGKITAIGGAPTPP